MQQLPNHREAAFVARKQEKLPMKELLRQKSSPSTDPVSEAGDVSTNSIAVGEGLPPTLAQDKSLQPQIIPPQQPPPFLVQQQSGPLPEQRNSPTTEEKSLSQQPSGLDFKLSDIVVKLEDVSPHPSLGAVQLVEGGVTVQLHPTTNTPKPSVSVYVLQITNTLKNQVCYPVYSFVRSLITLICASLQS